MRCALYFGSFNPLHKGHVAIARYVMENCKVDSVRLVLSPQSPFKDNTILQDPQLRLQELSRSIERFNTEYAAQVQATSERTNIKFLEISTIEFAQTTHITHFNTSNQLNLIQPSLL